MKYYKVTNRSNPYFDKVYPKAINNSPSKFIYLSVPNPVLFSCEDVEEFTVKLGLYVDSSKDIYTGAYIIRFAISLGWRQWGFDNETHYSDAYLSRHKSYNDFWLEAVDYIQKKIYVEGCYWGTNEQNHWGLWPTEQYLLAKSAHDALISLEALRNGGGRYFDAAKMEDSVNMLEDVFKNTRIPRDIFS